VDGVSLRVGVEVENAGWAVVERCEVLQVLENGRVAVSEFLARLLCWFKRRLPIVHEVALVCWGCEAGLVVALVKQVSVGVIELFCFACCELASVKELFQVTFVHARR
jgi:hypothetical protein